MAGVNLVILVGRLGSDPELRWTQSGKQCASFSLATSESWTRDGQKEEKTEWHRIVAWEKLAELAGKYLKKGMQVYLEGKLQTRKYKDTNNIERYVTEILAQKYNFIDSLKSKENSNNINQYSDQNEDQYSGQNEQQNKSRPIDDDIPF